MNFPNKDIRNLNEQVFEQLFRDYFKPLTAFAKKYTGDIDSAKELVHDVFLNLWTKRAEIDPDKSVKSYLYTSTYNRSLNYIRDNKKFNKDVSVEFESEKNQNWEFSSHVDTIELEEKINRTIEQLPQKCREVFVLSRFEGLKYNEIADKLGISVKTVETQISKALLTLRTELKEYLTVFLIFLLIR